MGELVTPPHTDVRIYSGEPQVILAWGDDGAVVTICRDDLAWSGNQGAVWVPNELQRTLMVARLRYIAQVLEDAGKGPG